ncbi:MAG: hypothetical protein JWL76_2142 [Thermoleophilia bacterium]|nr:hypothetical protein [Thermoleophilia bacterium]
MGVALFDLSATFSGRSASLNAGSYTVLDGGTSFGQVVRAPMFPQVFDAQRVVVAGAPVGAREQQIRVEVSSSTIAGLAAQLETLDRLCEDITRQGGGVLKHRSTDGAASTRFRVAAAKLSAPELMGAHYERAFRTVVVLALVADPFGMSDALDLRDGFSVNTLGTAGAYNTGGSDWTADAGALTNLSVTGGVLAGSANLTTENRLTHTGSSVTVADVAVRVKHTVGTTLTGYKAGVTHTRLDASNLLTAFVSDDGAASTLRIQKIVAGVPTTLGSATALTRLVAGTAYWVVGRIEGNVLYAEHWLAEPTPMGTPAATATYTLTTAEAVQFGVNVQGRTGVVFTPQHATASIDDFCSDAFTFKGITFPATLRLGGSFGGTTDALAGIYYTGSGGTAPVAMMYAWWPRVAAHNMVWNGGAEVVGVVATTAYGWNANTTSYLTTGAAVTRTVAAGEFRSGIAAIKVVTPATVNTGTAFPIYRRGGFRKGVAYTAECWVKSAAGTTTTQLLLGDTTATSLGSTSSVALSATWTLKTVTWTPAADCDVAHLTLRQTAATITTFFIDDVQVYEGTTAPTSALGGFGPGIIPGAAYNAAQGSLTGTYFAPAVNASYLVGTGVIGTGAMASAANIELPLLPHLFTPDDFTSDEIDVAVFARCYVESTQTSLACAISMASERGTSYGARRYGSLRSGGKTLKLPVGGNVFKSYFLGFVTLKVDKQRPRREWLRLSFTNSGAATGSFGLDYVTVVPLRSIASSRRGFSASGVPLFIASTAETTKTVGIGTNGEVLGQPGTGGVVDWVNGAAVTPDDGLLGEPIVLPPDGAELLVWPSSQVIDVTDSTAAGNVVTHVGTVQVTVQPRVALLKQ